ncbi:myosin-11 isoform X2 [Tribolium madens]|uniref:myosin-11 isoform X2 n=1 Tax=Tribolium madens TaxID=41895 RepID=UPI001CF72986|nr:myosin-11 isoform X2 [Tribolium madens]
MSANIYMMSSSKPRESRIPVASPVPLRRSGSVRLRAKSPNRSANLQRGTSFMERGERYAKHGAPGIPESPSRSLSLHRITPNTPPTTPDGHTCDWDSESLTSVTSVGSCDHASVARNGTTFSGRSMKYVFHCSQHSGATGEDYLTPTQRLHRQVKKLKILLHQAKKELDDKDSDILKLTKEVVELRLYKAAFNSPEDRSNSSDAVTVRENTDEQITPDVDTADRSVVQNEMTNSYTDSGHFDDYINSPVATRSPMKRKMDLADKAITAALGDNNEHTNLILEYERRLQELVKTHEEETHQLKQKHNDKIEELLERITEINKRYWELVPELDLAKSKIKELESQLEDACQKLAQQEEKQKKTYLEMYQKGQEAANLERENRVIEIAKQGPSRISVPELLEELQVTKNELENIKAMYRQLIEAKNKSKIDPEITLQFLKSAVYYFLTDKENSQGHLKAIQSILGFTPNEISSIDKARLS